MHHEEHITTETTEKKSIHTNGAGLLLLAAVAILMAIFCWDMWKDGDKAAEHYRYEKKAHHQAEGHEMPAENHH